jgi:hypothetical protein
MIRYIIQRTFRGRGPRRLIDRSSPSSRIRHDPPPVGLGVACRHSMCLSPVVQYDMVRWLLCRGGDVTCTGQYRNMEDGRWDMGHGRWKMSEINPRLADDWCWMLQREEGFPAPVAKERPVVLQFHQALMIDGAVAGSNIPKNMPPLNR